MEVASGALVRCAEIGAKKSAVLRIDLAFLTLASACLIGGVGIGISMGIQRDFALAPVHAHLNLLGWVSLAIYGLVYRAYPQLAGPRVAIAHFALSGSSAVLFPIGLYLEIFHHAPSLIAGAAIMWFAGAALFFVLLARLAVFRPSAPHVVAE